MKESLISFDTSKLAYEMGYTRETVGISFTSTRRNYYTSDGILNGDCTGFIQDILKYGREKARIDHILYPATSQSLLQKWLREEHKIFVTVSTPRYYEFGNYTCSVRKENFDYGIEPLAGEDKTIFSTYEEALEEGLIGALRLI